MRIRALLGGVLRLPRGWASDPTVVRRWRLTGIVLASTLAAATLGGCSAEQIYGAGQAWQRNECDRLADADQRDRCLAGTSTSYGEYQSKRRSAVEAR